MQQATAFAINDGANTDAPSIGSTLTYHITIAARRRPEQSHSTYFYPRTEIYARTDNKVFAPVFGSV